jgi:hypothetical protein
MVISALIQFKQMSKTDNNPVVLASPFLDHKCKKPKTNSIQPPIIHSQEIIFPIGPTTKSNCCWLVILDFIG